MAEHQLADRIAALEARVAEFDDERSIREVLSRYGYYADACRDEDYLDLWTEDGVMDLTVGNHPRYEDRIVWQGKDALRAFITDPTAHHRPGFYGQSLHLQGNNLRIHLDGDEAIVNSYSVVLKQIDGRTVLASAGTNRWRFRRENGRWRIRERVRREVGDAETADVLAGPDLPTPAGT